MIKRAFVLLLGLFILGAAYLLAWPVPIEPVAWRAPVFAGYAGPHAVNDRLAGLQHLPLAGAIGPEHIAIGPDGFLYTGVASGDVVRMRPDGSAREVFVRTGGRPLGLAFDRAGRLIVADAMRGLLAVGAGGRIDVLAARVGRDPIRYADGVVVATSGRIYFTDASRRFSPRDLGSFEASVYDIFEQAATGRVLEFDPATRVAREVITNLSFANGIALTSDERHLLVVETGRYRVWKVAVDADGLNAKTLAPGEARARVLLDNLPGYPDNLTRGREGRFWLGLTKPRAAVVDQIATRPFVRKIVMRLPRSTWPVPPDYGHVFAFAEDGRILADLQDPKGAYPQTTGVTEGADRLYIQSLIADSIGWMPKPALPPG